MASSESSTYESVQAVLIGKGAIRCLLALVKPKLTRNDVDGHLQSSSISGSSSCLGVLFEGFDNGVIIATEEGVGSTTSGDTLAIESAFF